MPLSDLITFSAGLLALVIGGDALVRGAASVARGMGIAPLVVGLTVIAFGTSAPELAVSMASALTGSAPLALGNVVGSNIFNILLVLGATAALHPLCVRDQLVRFDVPVLVASSLALVLMSLDGWIGRIEAIFLFASLLAYITWTVRRALRDGGEEPTDSDREEGAEGEESEGGGRVELLLIAIAVGALLLMGAAAEIPRYVAAPLAASLVAYRVVSRRSDSDASLAFAWIMLGLGLVAVPLSAHVLVIGAVGIAHAFGASDAVIGLTVVAAGTSAPEAVASITAARRGQADMAIGNLIGSNIFNVLCIVGLTGALIPLPVAPELLGFDYAVMAVVSVGLWGLLWWRRRVGRSAGLLMLGLFAAYLAVQLARVL